MRALFLALPLLVGCPGDRCDEPGAICTVAGTGTAGLGDEDVAAVDTHLYLPQDLTIGPDGQPYLLDWNNHRIRTIDAEGIISTVAGNGLLGDGPEGPALDAAFNHPTNVTFDGAGRMVIAAWHNSRIERVNLTTGELEFICGTGGRGYNGDGIPAIEAILDLPSSVMFHEGRTFITDQANQQIRMIDEDDVIWDVVGVQREAGYSGDGGPASEALLHASIGQAADPSSRAILHDGALYIADTGNHVIRIVDLDTWTIDTFAGAKTCDDDGTCEATAGYGGDGGDRLDATFNAPTDLAAGPDGTVYVADTSNHCVRAIDPDGTVTTAAGTCGTPGFEGDEGPATEALLNRPYGIEVDGEGDLWIADTYNHRIRVVRR